MKTTYLSLRFQNVFSLIGWLLMLNNWLWTPKFGGLSSNKDFETYLKAAGYGSFFDAETYYEAVRIIQDGNKLKLQLNDAKFSRTICNSDCDDDDERFIEWTRAEDCTNGEVESIADLSGIPLKFANNVESLYVAGGHLGRGGAEVSMERQVLTVETGGYCGHTYIADDQNDLLEVNF